ncbi:MAG TPA: type II toxin-antitoxin system VapC family toxin [Thermoanaerobaculia bacterium]|nr:type II toxin-antitoxin system VapC family toxin [Thermoanaerobaculia bacterium]
MIVDASAIIALLFDEPGSDSLKERLLGAAHAGVAASTLVEAGLVVSARTKRNAMPDLERFVRDFGLVVIPFEEEHARAAVEAFLRFGKGRHRAALDFGDCMAYAVAKLAGQPLLCTGDDFRRTDLDVA